MTKTPINQVLAFNLAEYMQERGLKQLALAKKSGVDQKTISNYLTPENRTVGKSGKPPSAKLAEVEKIAEALGIDAWELISPLTLAQKQFYRSLEGMVRDTRWQNTETRHPAPPMIRGEGKDYPKIKTVAAKKKGKPRPPRAAS